MNIFHRKSDGELVAAIEKSMRWRPWAGWVLAAPGVVVFVTSIVTQIRVSRGILRIADSLSNIHHVTDEAAFKSAANLSYRVGIRTGMLLGQAMVSGPMLVIVGAFFVYGGRKDRLLTASFRRPGVR